MIAGSGAMNDVLSPMLKRAAMPAAWAYQRIIGARNARYDAGRGVRRINRPVISVGNVTVGGTGKTPMVQWIARLLREAGREPAIAMRGYGAAPGQIGDEQAELQWRLPDTPVVARPDRYEALTEFLPAHPHIDCIVLDDGFQHRQLWRDLDLVLIDATADTFSQRLLPAGRLREPLQSLARADAVIVTRAAAFDAALDERIAHFHGKPATAWAEHRWSDLLVWDRAGQRHETVSWLDGKSVVTMLGVGNPKSIEKQIESAGASIAARIPAADHQRYDRALLNTARGLCSEHVPLVVTAKDWVKVKRLIDLSHWPGAVVVPELVMDFHRGGEALRAMIMQAVSRAQR